jgi:hypothetical protein
MVLSEVYEQRRATLGGGAGGVEAWGGAGLEEAPRLLHARHPPICRFCLP